MLLAHMDKVYPEVPSHPRVSEQPGIAYPGLPTSSREALLLICLLIRPGFGRKRTFGADFLVGWNLETSERPWGPHLSLVGSMWSSRDRPQVPGCPTGPFLAVLGSGNLQPEAFTSPILLQAWVGLSATSATFLAWYGPRRLFWTKTGRFLAWDVW